MAARSGFLGIAVMVLLSVKVCGDAIPYPTPTPTTAATVAPLTISSSPTSAVSHAVGSTDDLYLVALPDGEPQLLLHSDRLPSLLWSPDGNRFAYVLGGELLVFDPNNPHQPVARAPVDSDSYPVAWSEHSILVGNTEIHNRTISVVNDETGETRLISSVGGFGASAFFVGWLDADHALFAESAGGLSQLAVYGLRLADAVRVGIRGISETVRPVISPDRRTVAWSDDCGDPGDSDGIWLAEVGTWTPRKISDACGLTDIAWSPDGSELAFTALYTTVHEGWEDTAGLYVINLQPGQTRRITRPSPTVDPLTGGSVKQVELQVEWLADGGFKVLRGMKRCSDCRGTESFVVSADGSEETPIEDGAIDSSDGIGDLRLTDAGILFHPVNGSAPRLLLAAQPDWSISGEFAPSGRCATLRKHPN